MHDFIDGGLRGLRHPAGRLLLWLGLGLGPGLGPGDATAAPAGDAPSTYIAVNPGARRVAFGLLVERQALGPRHGVWGVHALYAQSSFWSLDHRDKTYRVESDYEPEIRLRLDGRGLRRVLSGWPRGLGARLAYSHHSNGIEHVDSRGWNRVDLGLDLGDPQARPLSGAVTVWVPFNVQDTNADITDYVGHGQAVLDLRPRRTLAGLGRTRLRVALGLDLDGPLDHAFPNLETTLAFAPSWLARRPFPAADRVDADGHAHPDFAFFLQWYVGRGESLTEYRAFRNVVRLGFQLW